MLASRREFVAGLAAAGVGLGLKRLGLAQSTARAGNEVRLAIVGAGTQGRNLVSLCRKLPGVRFAAVCDVWPYHQKYAAAILKRSSGPVNVYEDYGDLLASEKDLDAVIIATPDWMHAEHTIACLKAGLHVYCEKPMAGCHGDAACEAEPNTSLCGRGAEVCILVPGRVCALPFRRPVVYCWYGDGDQPISPGRASSTRAPRRTDAQTEYARPAECHKSRNKCVSPELP